MLFDEVAAREAGERDPVAEAFARLASDLQRLSPRQADGGVGLHQAGPADRAVVDPRDHLYHAGITTEAEARHEREPVGAAAGRRCGSPHDSRGIDSHRLLTIDMLAGGHRGFQMERPRVRRRGEQHDVDAAVDHTAVGILTDETLRGRAVKPFPRGSEHLRRRRDLIREDVAECHHPDRGIGFKSLQCRTGAAATASHQTDAEPLLAGSKESACRQRDEGGTRRCHSAAEERPPRRAARGGGALGSGVRGDRGIPRGREGCRGRLGSHVAVLRSGGDNEATQALASSLWRVSAATQTGSPHRAPERSRVMCLNSGSSRSFGDAPNAVLKSRRRSSWESSARGSLREIVRR